MSLSTLRRSAFASPPLRFLASLNYVSFPAAFSSSISSLSSSSHHHHLHHHQRNNNRNHRHDRGRGGYDRRYHDKKWYGDFKWNERRLKVVLGLFLGGSLFASPFFHRQLDSLVSFALPPLPSFPLALAADGATGDGVAANHDALPIVDADVATAAAAEESNDEDGDAPIELVEDNSPSDDDEAAVVVVEQQQQPSSHYAAVPSDEELERKESLEVSSQRVESMEDPQRRVDHQRQQRQIPSSSTLLRPVDRELSSVDLKMEKDLAETTTTKKRIGFRHRRIIEYENRIRAYSTPDKVFRYFATLQAKSDVEGNQERSMLTSSPVYMTPEDFVRSLTPGAMQPEGLGLDQFQRFDPKKFKPGPKSNLNEDSIFFKLAENGLITFSDYLFLLTMLSTPPRHFEMAFKMFDFDGDGNVDVAEFEKVQNILRRRTNVGRRHRDHSNTGSVMKSIQPALTSYFFGKNKDEKLTVEKFIRFQKRLQQEILGIEFHRYNLNPDGTLKETDFADCLLTHAGLSEKKMARMKRRVKKAFMEKEEEGDKEGQEEEEEEEEENEEEDKKEDEEKEEDAGMEKLNADSTNQINGIKFQEFVDFFSFLNYINEVDVALGFYHIAGAPINKATFAHVAEKVADVRASKHVIDVIFVLFDENKDEHLSHKEFISVMKQRGLRGLEKSRDTGFANLLTAFWKCGKNQIHDKIVLGGNNNGDNNINRRRMRR